MLAKSGIPVLDMAANTADLGKLIATAIAPKIAEYGLSIPEFYIENISLPEEVEKVLDKRTSMGVAGDLNKYMQFNAAEGMAQPGNGMGAMVGAGMAAGMGMNMASGAGPWGAAPAAARRRRHRRLRARLGMWPRMARPKGRSAKAIWPAWRPRARLSRASPGLDGGSGRLESRERHRACQAVRDGAATTSGRLMHHGRDGSKPLALRAMRGRPALCAGSDRVEM